MLELVRAGDLEAMRTATKRLPEAERRRLAPAAIALLGTVRVAWIGQVMKKPWPFTGTVDNVLHSAQVLALATITPAELGKIGPWALPPDDLALETLIDRAIPVADFVEAIANQPPGRWISRFNLMRALLRASKTEPPSHPGYVLSMIDGLAGTVYDALKTDPTLLECELWHLFEIEGGGQNSLAAHDKYIPEERSWTWALTRLCAEGLVARDRLLDASLAALRRDFAPFRAGWFSRFHERLEPTRDERQQRERDYLALISSPVPSTVSFTRPGASARGRCFRAGGRSPRAGAPRESDFYRKVRHQTPAEDTTWWPPRRRGARPGIARGASRVDHLHRTSRRSGTAAHGSPCTRRA